ncbi:hypothetical protein D9M72_281560 [compost metagenome]
MDRLQVGNARLHVVGQLFIGRGHVDPDGVAAHFGAGNTAQHRAHRGNLAPGHIGVVQVLAPALFAVAAEHHQFGMLGMVGEHRMHFEFTEAARDGHVLRRRDRLLAEEQHLVRQQRGAQPEVGGVIQGFAEIDAFDFGADGGRAAAHGERPGGRVLRAERFRAEGQGGGLHALSPLWWLLRMQFAARTSQAATGFQRVVALIRSAAFSPIMIAGALVLPPTSVGITEASATRSPSRPRTRSSGSTTAMSSIPILQVPTGW